MRRDEKGASALELCLWVIPVLGVGVLLAMMAQIPLAKLDVTAAANDAARAASLQRDSATASSAAADAARTAIDDAGRSCAGVTVAIDASDFGPNGSVTVTVRCTAEFGDLIGVGIPGGRSFVATAVSPIDQYRSAS